ncbi:MAG: hypothetical protein AAF531_09655 [Actinomycetota bacterium]
MSRTFRTSELWWIAVAFGVAATGVWFLGVVTGSSLLRYAGFMAGASTFVPLPADAYVLNVAANNAALTLGVVGGAVNAVAVLAERQWILRAASHPVFDRFSEFIGTNRWIDMAERHMFVGLVVGGFSFLPFEPFRLVAVLRGYHQFRYALATFFGRGIRYYWLARAGSVFAVYGLVEYVVWGSLLIFTVGLFRSYLRFRATYPVAEEGGAHG